MEVPAGKKKVERSEADASSGGDLRVVVVDDEEPARLLLREYLRDMPGVELVAECANGFEAVKAVSEHAPDLLLLDIQMPKLDGFEVVELLGDEAPAVIFTTAYDQYALRAFEIHAVDYLLEPFDAARLAEAIDRVRREPGRHRPPAELASDARASEAAGDGEPAGMPLYVDRILVRDGSSIHVLPCREIDYIEAQDDVVELVSGGLRLRKAERMARLEASLDPRQFVRIHRSYLLNVERLARLELYAKDSRVAILRDESRLPVSRAGYGRLRELL